MEETFLLPPVNVPTQGLWNAVFTICASPDLVLKVIFFSYGGKKDITHFPVSLSILHKLAQNKSARDYKVTR